METEQISELLTLPVHSIAVKSISPRFLFLFWRALTQCARIHQAFKYIRSCTCTNEKKNISWWWPCVYFFYYDETNDDDDCVIYTSIIYHGCGICLFNTFVQKQPPSSPAESIVTATATSLGTTTTATTIPCAVSTPSVHKKRIKGTLPTHVKDGDDEKRRRTNYEVSETRGRADGSDGEVNDDGGGGDGTTLGNPTKIIDKIPKGNTQHKQTKAPQRLHAAKTQQIDTSAAAAISDKLTGSSKLSLPSSSEDENEENDSLLKDEKKVKKNTHHPIISGLEGGSAHTSGPTVAFASRNNDLSTFEIEEANGSSSHVSHSAKSTATARVRRLRWWISSGGNASGGSGRSATGLVTSTMGSNGGCNSPTTSGPPSTGWNRNRKRLRWKWMVSSQPKY